jgi:transcription termination factor NusB
MTPKEKAQELVDKMYHYQWREKERAKECVLIAVDEIINNQKKITKNINKHLSTVNIEIQDTSNYWDEVKQEIEKL